MHLGVALAFGSALGGTLVALLTLLRVPRAGWRYPLACGMLSIAGELAAQAFGMRSPDPDATMRWWRIAVSCSGLVPGAWIAFSLSFARAEAWGLLWRSRYLLAASLALPLALVTLLREQLFAAATVLPVWGPYLPLGWAGYALQLAQLLAAVVVLANLERTLHAATGSRRWLIKFVVIGVGTLFALRIYVASQSLLFRALDTRLLTVSAAAFALAQLSILVAYIRTRLRPIDVYLSSTALYGSFTTLLVAGYLLVVGLIAAAAARLGGGAALPLASLVLLGAFWLLSVLLLSDELRHRLRLLISRHFRRPLYDYRLEWRRFTEGTGATLDVRQLCSSIAAWIAETLKLPAVSVWLVDESGAVALGGSTLRTERAPEDAERSAHITGAILRALGERTEPVDLSPLQLPELVREPAEDMRFAMALRAGRQTVGLITHSARATGDALTAEDLELLRTVGDQAASRLLGVRLSDQLARARQMEAFQTLSAFFVHDLKNLASRLSLSLHNLPERIEDPAFRADFVATLSRSVARMDEMCTRLSPLARRLELRLEPQDLAGIVTETLAGLETTLSGRLERRFEAVPLVSCDREQLQKVVMNLVLNADEALNGHGNITVGTEFVEGAAVLTVSDDGAGMSREFIQKSLFQPFRSTKPKGLGIGLYQTRRIVEAHGGRIDVDSEPGRGTTFKVLLPCPRA